MAGEAEHEDEELFVPEAEADDEQEGQDQGDEGGDSPEDDADETVISFGEDDPDEQDGAGLVPHLRAQLRQLSKENRELKTTSAAPQPIIVGDKPTMEGCDYDEDRYDAELIAWTDRGAKAEQANAQANKGATDLVATVKQRSAKVAADKAAMKAPDADERFADVSSALSLEQAAALVMTADNAANLIYALGDAKSATRLQKLAAISNPYKFAVAVSELERDLKVTTKRRAPAPEGTVRGSAPLSAGKADKELARLEKEAARTGDRSDLIRHQRAQRLKSEGQR